MVRRFSVQSRSVAMQTLRRIQAVSVRVAPHWLLCVFLGGYVAMQMAAPALVVG